jgi:glycosyltransferase involved in cell wall biosynthesis
MPSRDRYSYLQNVAVVIPAFNEALVIGSIVIQTLRYVTKVIVVDDGSKDNTATIAECAGAEVIRMGTNQGKASAIMTGFAYAKESGYENVVMLDGDGQHDPNEIPLMVIPVISGAADLVIGSRYLSERNFIPPYRVAGQWILNEFTRMVSNVRITDSQSGFRVLGKKALENLNFPSIGYNLESDMITHFATCDIRMLEMPISVRYDVPNMHKMNPVFHGLGILRNLLMQISRQSSFQVKVPGILAMVLVSGYGLFCLSNITRNAFFQYHILTIGMFTIITGSYGINYAIRKKS